jgi:hypothetical protein
MSTVTADVTLNFAWSMTGARGDSSSTYGMHHMLVLRDPDCRVFRTLRLHPVSPLHDRQSAMQIRVAIKEVLDVEEVLSSDYLNSSLQPFQIND